MARTPHVRIAPGLPLRTFVFSPLRGVAGYVEPGFPHPGLVRRLRGHGITRLELHCGDVFWNPVSVAEHWVLRKNMISMGAQNIWTSCTVLGLVQRTVRYMSYDIIYAIGVGAE